MEYSKLFGYLLKKVSFIVIVSLFGNSITQSFEPLSKLYSNPKNDI